jgi:hypothetical protein
MWLLITTLAVAALIVIVTRGSFVRLVQLPIRSSWLLFAGLGLQIALEFVDLPRDQLETTGYGLLMGSYALLLAFCFVNISLRGMGLIAVGIVLNILVIGLNQGMPARAIGLDRNGNRIHKPIEHTVKHRPERPDDMLTFLSDQILLPNPFDALVSAGDLVLCAGICELAYFGSRRGRTRRRTPHRARGSAPRRLKTVSSAASTRPSYTYPGPV